MIILPIIQYVCLLLSPAAAVAVWYLFLHYVYKPWKTFQFFSKEIRGPTALPIVGNAHQLEADPTKFYQQVLGFCRDYPKLFRIMMGPIPMVVISNAKDAETIFGSTKHTTKSFVYDFLQPWLGTGLLTSKQSKWFHRRKLLTPAFHFSILNSFLTVFNEKSDILKARLEKFGDGRVFDIFPMITQCSLDIICETAMGKNIYAQVEGENKYVQAVIKMSELVLERMKFPWFWPDMVYNIFANGKEQARCLKILHDTTNTVIRERQKDFIKLYPNGLEDRSTTEPKGVRLAFLDLLLSMKQQDHSLTFDDIREEVDTFMFEGHDTTAAGTSWCLYLLGQHPVIQKKVHEELDEVFGDAGKPATSLQLQQLHYLTCVLKESLRIFPSVPYIGRILEEDCVLGGHNIPAGTNVTVLITGLHRDTDVFPNPEEFDPDRFLNENCRNRHPYAYVPFSAGARNCIGQRFAMMEEKVIVSSILRRFSIDSVQTRHEISPVAELILRPSSGIQIRLTPRN